MTQKTAQNLHTTSKLNTVNYKDQTVSDKHKATDPRVKVRPTSMKRNASDNKLSETIRARVDHHNQYYQHLQQEKRSSIESRSMSVDNLPSTNMFKRQKTEVVKVP